MTKVESWNENKSMLIARICERVLGVIVSRSKLFDRQVATEDLFMIDRTKLRRMSYSHIPANPELLQTLPEAVQ